MIAFTDVFIFLQLKDTIFKMPLCLVSVLVFVILDCSVPCSSLKKSHQLLFGTAVH